MKNLIFKFFIFWCSFTYAAEFKTVEELKGHVAEVLPKIEGWCSKEKASAFIDLVLQEKPKVYVEIGVFAGASLFPVASALKFLNNGGFIIGIDPWNNKECTKNFDPLIHDSFVTWWNNIHLEWIYHSVLNLVRQENLEDYRLLMRTTSEKAAVFIEEIDILYLDGNHSIQSLSKDVDLYVPKVRSGGYIWLNDFTRENIKKVLDQLLQCCEYISSVDNGNCVLFRKI